MLSTSNRFIATAIGKGDMNRVNIVFNVSLIVHVACAVVVLLFGLTIGDWYVYNYVNYDGDINIAVKIFNTSLVSSALSFIGVPFNGLLMAKERFGVFCLSDIVIYPIKLLLCYGLFYIDTNRVIAYALISAFSIVMPAVIYFLYCRFKFKDIITPKIVTDWSLYREVLGFSIWVGYGAIVQVGKSQGAALLVNAFFNTIMNTALGIANQLHSFILMFVQNISKPIAPQITKNYSKGDMKRCHTLMAMTSKLSYMFMFWISLPLLLCPEYLLTLWLGEVPPYSVLFVRLMVVNSLIDSFNLGIAEYVFASGNIKKYQVITNTVLLCSIVVGYAVLKMGAQAYSLLLVYIIFSIIAVVVRQIILRIDHDFDNKILIKGSYYPSLLVTILACPVFVLPFFFGDLFCICLSVITFPVIVFFTGLTKKERLFIVALAERAVLRLKR